MKIRWSLCVSCSVLLGCAEDPFSDDPIKDPSYPNLSHIKIPDSTAQPHSVFNSVTSIEQNIDASRQKEIALHKRLWKTAKEPVLERASIEKSATSQK
ncbi:MAG: hypothetical protein LBQ26_02030 [Holosporales bacterium]|jgi:hypothetical protein|nr:hypothetical protein [Holosporales bacterium]